MKRALSRQWMLPLALLLFGLAALGPVAPTDAKPAVESDKFFQDGKVLKLEIELGPKELAALRGAPRTYVKATLKEGDKVVYKDVGVHVKGAAGSFRGIDDKPGLTVSMRKFKRGERFHGMAKFHLANSVQDPSYLLKLLCGELFREAGVPASRVAHAVVWINGKRRGLYYLKEGYDRYFLKRHFGNRRGNFYDGGFLRDIDQPLQQLAGKADVKMHADLKALLAASREPKLDERFKKMEKLLDLDKFLSYLALEVITWDWDGYPMQQNNYRIYHDPKRDKIVFIPSGMDQMFGDPNGPVLPHFKGVVARALLETPQGRARYFARLAEIMKKTYRTDDRIKRLDELQKRLQPVLASLDAGTGRDYPNQVNRLRGAIKQREKSIEAQLKRIKK